MIGYVGLTHLGLVYALASAKKGMNVTAYTDDLNLFNWWTAGMYHLGLSKEMVKRHTNRFWCSALVAFAQDRAISQREA